MGKGHKHGLHEVEIELVRILYGTNIRGIDVSLISKMLKHARYPDVAAIAGVSS